MTTPPTDPAAAGFDALLDALHAAADLVRDPARGRSDAVGRAEGYAYMTELLRVALDLYADADGAAPRFVPLSSPTPYHGGQLAIGRVQGGANPDAVYDFAWLDPERAYRITGVRGNDCYLSLSFSGGQPGERPDRTVTTLNDRQLTFGPGGEFDVVVSADVHQGNWVRMEPDVSSVIVRQYFEHPIPERRLATLAIDVLDARDGADAGPGAHDPGRIARRLGAAAAFVRSTNASFPFPAGALHNAFSEPLGYTGEAGALGTTDNVYVMGRWQLAPGEQLVIETTPARCRYWSLQAWNHWGQSLTGTLDPAADYPHQIVSSATAVPEPDGSVRVVLAEADPGVPNWLRTLGWTDGVLILRYLYPEEEPSRPDTRVEGAGRPSSVA
jgi:hypothetical protein